MIWNWKNVRDPVFFLLGAFVFIHEVLATGAERPTILAASLALMGVPAFLRRDEAVAARAVKEARAELEQSHPVKAAQEAKEEREET
jgi:hypothetical protein